MHAFQSNSYNPYLNQYYLLNEVDPRKQWALLSTEEDDQATISSKFIQTMCDLSHGVRIYASQAIHW